LNFVNFNLKGYFISTLLLFLRIEEDYNMMNKSKSNINDSMFVSLPLSVIESNDGQLDGLPANPRSITDEKLRLLKQNIQEYPEMLSLRGLMVYPLDGGRYITIGGNMRLRALQLLGYTEAPCIVIPKETSIDQLKAYSVIDNSGFGKWDWDMLANEWDEKQLTDWGVDLPILPTEEKTEKDLSDKVGDTFEVVVECSSELEQEKVFNELMEGGYKCRVLTL
jgi:hypothetical protein